MPVEQRQALAKKLKQFDSLSQDAQASLRLLDSQLSELEPALRARYLDTLRRYHLWRLRLSEEQRRKLDAASPDKRLELVKQLRSQVPPIASPNESINQIQVGLSATSLKETTFLLRTWGQLDKAERKQVEAAKDLGSRLKLMESLAARHGIQKFAGSDDTQFAIDLDRLEKAFAKRIEANSKASASKRKTDPRKLLEGLALKKSDLRFLRNHEPGRIDQSRLERFEKQIPDWIRETMDSLPPDAARRRLRVLYRLVYPTEEIAEPPSNSEPNASKAPESDTAKRAF